MNTEDMYAGTLEERLSATPATALEARIEELEEQLQASDTRREAAEAVCRKLLTFRKDSQADLTCTAPHSTVDELLEDWEREVARQECG